MPAFDRFQPPQFQSDPTLPQWQPMMGDEQNPNFTPLVDALKKRMTKSQQGGVGSMMSGEMSGTMKSGGGMQSL